MSARGLHNRNIKRSIVVAGLLVFLSVIISEAYSAPANLTANPLQNGGTNGTLTISSNWNVPSSKITRHESVTITRNGSSQITSITVGGQKQSHTGTRQVTVYLRDKNSSTLDSGSANLPSSAGAYNTVVTMTGSNILYSRVASVAIEYSGTSYVTLGADGDSHVRQDSASNNYGTDTTMSVRSRSSSRNWRAYVSFNVSSIPAGSTVDSATLTLYTTSVPGSTRTYGIYAATSTWNQSTITWNTQPGVSAVQTASTTTPASATPMTWTVTSDVQAWVNGSTNYGWQIRDNTENASPATTTDYGTSENSTASLRPKLEVYYIEP